MGSKLRVDDIVEFLYLGGRAEYDHVSISPGMTNEMYDDHLGKWLGNKYTVSHVDETGFLHLREVSSREIEGFIFSPNWVRKISTFEYDDNNII